MKGLVAVVALIAAVGCTSTLAPAPSPPATATHAPSTRHATPPRATSPSPTPTVVRASQWPVPDDRLTPGAVVPCSRPQQRERDTTVAERRQVAAAYGYTGPTGLRYVEFDHRIPFKMCGSNRPANIWPEKYDGVSQSAFVHNYKDQLEAKIYSLLRTTPMTLAQAQAVFFGDWRHGWCVWVHRPGVVCDV